MRSSLLICEAFSKEALGEKYYYLETSSTVERVAWFPLLLYGQSYDTQHKGT